MSVVYLKLQHNIFQNHKTITIIRSMNVSTQLTNYNETSQIITKNIFGLAVKGGTNNFGKHIRQILLTNTL